MILPIGSALIKDTDGQYCLEYGECKYITDRKHPGLRLTMTSDHDPLRATMLVKLKLPTLTISYCNVNKN